MARNSTNLNHTTNKYNVSYKSKLKLDVKKIDFIFDTGSPYTNVPKNIERGNWKPTRLNRKEPFRSEQKSKKSRGKNAKVQSSHTEITKNNYQEQHTTIFLIGSDEEIESNKQKGG